MSEASITDQPFSWSSEIIYIGVSRNLHKRLNQLDKVLKSGQGKHSGANKLVKDFPDYTVLVPHLYVSVEPTGSQAPDTDIEFWQELGTARKLECDSIAKYLRKFKRLPKYNSKSG
jgi:hypothetical protein